MAVSTKQPAFQFYTGDWLKDPELRRCSIAARGLWIDVLCLMHQMPTRGVLRTETGAAWSLDDVACAVQGATIELVNELVAKGVMKQAKRSGVLYSKRMIREYRQSRWKARAGSVGGSKRQADGKHPPSKPQANRKQKRGSSSSASAEGSTVDRRVDLKDIREEIRRYSLIVPPKSAANRSTLVKVAILRLSGVLSENDVADALEGIKLQSPGDAFGYWYTSLRDRVPSFEKHLAKTAIPKEFESSVNGNS